ncbi:2-succinyl-6-hydroxy-2,4-cyclohexadiene-1-carboxylate synthase [Laspinema olomoucense]|uniref:2-succinyl-6-hydroxy-2, 4-cyclohexadiene-1-carboxylate synthase n=2 Tax=Laspinema olomoucense TaxID=3231600 RepID=UPI0021BB12E0|nr:2-succinyl-6-hydroxy-2,4-cyclohexadiene-1-carboxylate synthase [Laspinema sp. D3d]MCT7974394.1 2-succinyl-6-hydroxy-2,4-cyclohexadiene-1-carboxylate synthase [Laspinema sp. D3d]MCT7990282.1 2-succinyl-6-hydroxy-2,4-cyclohexadiene-1-carboxylate synthase [Laspinema sp. D3a]
MLIKMPSLYQFHYKIFGNIQNPLILFLHGFMGKGENFSEVIQHLSDKFCCVTVDLPGHGKTRILGGDECYQMSQTAQGLIELLDELGIGRCYLLGYSMGGRLALYLTLHFPERFEKVILESASPGLQSAEGRSQRRHRDEILAHQLETGDFSSFLSQWYQQPLFESLRHHPSFDRLFQNRLQNQPKTLAISLRQMGSGRQPSLWEMLASEPVPLLLLVGEWDKKFQEINHKITQVCSLAQMEIIPDSGHTIHLENPSAYLKSVIKFFSG